MSAYHLGRSWSGTRLEDDCPCPKAACGLVLRETVGTDIGCDQHDFSAARTMRQRHAAEDCPSTVDTQGADHDQ